MLLWLIFAVMTAVATFAVIRPLIRHSEFASSGSDVAVYRDQLNEVERDLMDGLIGKAEGELARVEISRRLLAAADAQAALPAPNATSRAWRRRVIAAVSLVLVPVLAGGLYLWLGSPELATAQLAGRRSNVDAEGSVENLVAKVEAHLQRNPADGHGWEILAPVYMQLNRYSESVTAWQNTLQLLGENAERDANLGEALTAESNGVVTADAKAAFIRAMALDETNVTARYFLGLAAEQDGETDKAAKIWRDLIATAPAGAFWLSEVRGALARVEGNSAPLPGPSAAQMAAAANQPPEQQAAMIQNMVDRLATRLKQDGLDVAGWVRLVHSYNVLGDADKARGAAADARKALAGDPSKLEQLDAALKQSHANIAAVPAAAPGPSAAQMAAAANQPPEQQAAMIRSMVDRLAARLKQDGSDVDGWVRLVRSYNVLGDADKARDAAADARKALAGDPGKLEQLDAALKQLAANSAAAPVSPSNSSAARVPPGDMRSDQQGATMQQMIERLAARLNASGSDPEGWLMLVRSYQALGEKDKVTAAVSDARRALAGDSDKLERFDAAIRNFKIGE